MPDSNGGRQGEDSCIAGGLGVPDSNGGRQGEDSCIAGGLGVQEFVGNAQREFVREGVLKSGNVLISIKRS